MKYIVIALTIALGTSRFSAVLSAQFPTNQPFAFEARGEQYYSYSGHSDSASWFIESIRETRLFSITLECNDTSLPPGLIEFFKRTTVSHLTLIGMSEDNTKLVLAHVAHPERVTQITLGNTTLTTVPAEVLQYTSLTYIMLDTLVSAIPAWLFHDFVMLDDIHVGRGRVRLENYQPVSDHNSIQVGSFNGPDDLSINLDSLYQATGIWVVTETRGSLKSGYIRGKLYKAIDVWLQGEKFIGRMDFDHCGDFGFALYDQIQQCANNRAPFTDRDPARCREYLDLVRTKRVLRVDLVPEGVLIEGTFLVTGTQAERLRRFIYCTR